VCTLATSVIWLVIDVIGVVDLRLPFAIVAMSFSNNVVVCDSISECVLDHMGGLSTTCNTVIVTCRGHVTCNQHDL